MKVCVIFLIFVREGNTTTLGLILNILISTLIPNKTNLQNEELQQSDVAFLLYTPRNPTRATTLTESNLEKINTDTRIKVLIHGWLESSSSPWYRNMTKRYLQNKNVNVIQIDWSRLATMRYDKSASSTKVVGVVIGKFLANLYFSCGVPLENLHLIGHSLGAHVAGSAGREFLQLTQEKLHRITALDAANPLFEEPLPLFESVTKNDAMIVDAIHTDIALFGYRKPFGTVDFYPNGGFSQPGCLTDFFSIATISFQGFLRNIFCSHNRSNLYFTRSIHNDRYVGKRCKYWTYFVIGFCLQNDTAIMGDGYYHTSESKGVYYVRTGNKTLFIR